MRQLQLDSLRALAEGLSGLRVLFWGGSGRGFPGGDGPAEAAEVLPQVGIQIAYTHAGDPLEREKLAASYDVAIVTNTRVALLQSADPRLWNCADQTAWWFWDLRQGHVGAALKGRVGHVFNSYAGDWRSPQGELYRPEQWAHATGAKVHYCPQASPLREPGSAPDAPRILFVGDLKNRVYHQGRAEMVRRLGAQVLNASKREHRLAIEARLPALYPSSRYCLSMSPFAPGYTSVRTYSILACGGLLLLHRFPGADRLFRDGEHAVLFDTAEDAEARLLELDDRPEERQRIAENGRRLHATKHTVAHRVLDICRRVTGVSEDFAGWL